MIPDGVAIGHWSGAGTGVTVITVPPGTVASGEIRGGAPAEREFALLDPRRTVQHVDAVVLTGGSAFGLASADGVVRALAATGRGFPTAGGPVPIVPTLAIYDLLESDRRPGADEGVKALAAAGRAAVGGAIGAGTGATVGKWRGREHATRGGLGLAHVEAEGARWLAVAVVNALGDVIGRDGRVIAGSSAPPDAPAFPTAAPFEESANTTLVVMLTTARFDKATCHGLAGAAHDGFARALRPAHTSADGDAAIVLATCETDVHPDRAAHLTADLTAEAIRAAVGDGSASMDWAASGMVESGS